MGKNKSKTYKQEKGGEINGCFHPGLISIATHVPSVQVKSEPEETNHTLSNFMFHVLLFPGYILDTKRHLLVLGIQGTQNR